jgi:hypothetical protein
VLVAGSIAFLIALSAAAGAAAPAVPDEGRVPSSLHPGSPAAFAERAVGDREDGPARAGSSFRHAVELMILVVACGLVVAFCSASSSEQGGRRVLTRIRRR